MVVYYTMISENDEKKIIEQILSRNERVFIAFCKSYESLLYRFVFKMIRNKEETEEIVQDTFIDFIERLRDFRRESSLKTFLYAIAHNKAVDYIRKKKLKSILFSAIPAHIVERLAAVFMDDELEKKELREKIYSTLDMLPNDYRFVLRLKYMEGEHVRSIAQKLSKNFKTTESLLFRARKAFIKVFNSLV